MLSPIPRRGGWIIASALAHPAHVSLPRFGERVGPRIVLFEACSAFTRVTACTLATSPNFVTRLSPKASTASLPPQLLRSLPAGAFRRVGLSPTGKRRLSTAHPESGRSNDRSPGLPLARGVRRIRSRNFNSRSTARKRGSLRRSGWSHATGLHSGRLIFLSSVLQRGSLSN
jgi:hypothetical protein